MSRLNADRRHLVRFTLNGEPVSAEAEPRMLLTDFLRHTLGLPARTLVVSTACAAPAPSRLTAAQRVPASPSPFKSKAQGFAPSKASLQRREGSRSCRPPFAAITPCSAAFAQRAF